ncbi:penicillin-binding protein 2 [Desulfitobacterium sp.]|uniref:penicillin-binding protein 2 n=1 Tax=Desulfitobacterium sp. TaxID=49981 RepID=UPI002B20EC5E|nr:penicillin-binding protein 2 [Desulfitobacterium sp.]MEA4902341.1 penicillin-binding protein 2 [Desulfitobacterium sp.]
MEEQERKPYLHRLRGLGIVVLLVFAILAFNLWRLQISQSSYYATMAKGNVMQLVTVPPTRGDIKDCNGTLLATSVPEFAITIDWLDLQKAKNTDWKEVVHRLAGYIQPYWTNQAESVDAITEDIFAMIQNQQWERYRPVTVLSNVPETLQAVITEHQDELPGVSIDALPVRSYPQNFLMGQVLGYVREISPEEIPQFNEQPLAKQYGFTYTQGDLVGKMGVEKSYDYWLRGKEGTQQVVVDNSARPINKKVIQPAEPGKTVQLTLDANLQQTVQTTLDQVIAEVQKSHADAKAGAAVMIDVKTGKILAMASRPYMNPNDLIGTISEDVAEKYFKNEADAASYNRALSGLYPPGSTYKMLTAMAALDSKVVTPNESFRDVMSSLGSPSVQMQGTEEWGGGLDFGMVNMTRGLAHSSNIYFQIVGRRVFESNPELMKQLSNEFGLGVKSGIDLPGEATGIAPSAEWKKSYYGKLRDEKLKAIDTKYDPKISQATDEKTKQDLLKKKEAEIRDVNNWYNYESDWKIYDSFNNSIGQGYNVYTPLQLANYVATIVNGGKRMQPYVVDKILDPVSGEVVSQNEPKVLNNVSVSPEDMETVKKGMAAVTSGEGTAAWLFADVPEFTGGGKTGTAQLGSKDTIAGNLFNGMFVAFAPYDDPQVAFAGAVEYGGHGGETAGVVAKAAFMQYFGWKSTSGR